MNKSCLLFVVAWAGLVFCPVARAQFGQVDPGFRRPEFNRTVLPIRVISDRNGGLLWSFVNGAELQGGNGQPLGGLVRTLESGLLDTNFVTGPGLVGTLATAVQADGKILIGGRRPGEVTTNGLTIYRVLRLLTNGTIDATYNSPVFDGAPRFMTLQPDGRLVAGGPDAPVGNGGILDTVRLTCAFCIWNRRGSSRRLHMKRARRRARRAFAQRRRKTLLCFRDRSPRPA